MTKKREKLQEGLATKSSQNIKIVARKEEYKVWNNTKRDPKLLGK